MESTSVTAERSRISCGYDNGGDALDYAVNDDVLHVGVFDAMGHGLAATGVAAFALSA